MDQIKDAFQKVKQDIDSLNNEVSSLKQFLQDNQERFDSLDKTLLELSNKLENISKKELFTPSLPPTENLQIPTTPTHNPTHDLPLKVLNGQKLGISTGNDGVPTNKQTNKQTNQHMEKGTFGDALEILNSLDNIKKEIRQKFKRITDQEFLVFSTIYQMEQEGRVDYKIVSQRLNLTETSIRDYVGRLIKKGIPVEKTKINNKLVQLSISADLRKIAPLPVILQLREL
jgi:cell division septum initiation protein DivIVA